MTVGGATDGQLTFGGATDGQLVLKNSNISGLRQ
jgi:hypothetical protein